MGKIPNRYLIVPICDKCKAPIWDLHVVESNIPNIPIIRTLEPTRCPNCKMEIDHIEYISNTHTVIVKGSGY